MGDYFFFLRQSWQPDAEDLISSGEEVEYVDENTSLKVVITPETGSAGKVYFSEGDPSTHHFHSAEGLVDILIEGLGNADLDNSEIEDTITDVLE